MHNRNVTFAEFLNPCVGMMLSDSSFDIDQLNVGASDYFQVATLQKHFSFLEQPLTCADMNLEIDLRDVP